MSTRTYDDIAESVAAVDGWMTPEQGRRLFAAAARCPPGGRIVEIGSFRGKSTIVLATAAPDGVEIVAIDPHAGNDRGPQELVGFEAEAADDHAAFNANLAAAGVAGRVRHVRAFSDAAHAEVGDPIDVLYIDGAHRYAPARRDIAEWGRAGRRRRHAADPRLVLVDRRDARDPARAERRDAGSATSVVRARSPSTAPICPAVPEVVVANLVRQLAQLPWFAKNVALKVALSLGLGKAAMATRHGPY